MSFVSSAHESACCLQKDVILGNMKQRPQSAKVCTFESSGHDEKYSRSCKDKQIDESREDHPVAIRIENLKDDNHALLKERLHSLASSFRSRSAKVKSKISQPLSRSPSPPDEIEKSRLESLRVCDEDWMIPKAKVPLKEKTISILRGDAIDPQSYFNIAWLFVVCCAFLYNAWSIFLRSVFPYQTPSNVTQFMLVDYIFDAIYLMDMILFKSRVRFIENGQLIEDVRLTRTHYMRSFAFKLDFMSLAPLDLLYLRFGPNPLLRFPRVIKVHAFWEFFDRIDAAARSPYMIRIFRTLIYMMYLVHLNACAYYAMSVWEGLGSNDWVYNNKGNAYLRCFYFAIRTATSISGKMPKPNNIYEYIFMTISWLLGVFVFAFLIGQIRDIVATATQNKTFYRHIMDQSIRYMNNLNLPDHLQKKVRLWLTHTWYQQKTFEEGKILNLLPHKMKTDIALSVHYQMLKKVQLFQECERTVIRDLVVKLRPVLFLPGDYVCKKGEIGQEMYIVSKGKVCVTEGNTILVTLCEGSVFGEISVLGIPGCSRRNADVRSLGFSNLYVLSKADLWDTLRNYPEAQKLLRNKARKVMRERAKKEDAEEDAEVESIINLERPETTPKLFQAVIQAMPQESDIVRRMSRSSSIASASPSQFSIARSSFDAESSTSFGGSCVSVSLLNESLDTENANNTATGQLDEISEHDGICDGNNLSTNIIEDIMYAGKSSKRFSIN